MHSWVRKLEESVRKWLLCKSQWLVLEKGCCSQNRAREGTSGMLGEVLVFDIGDSSRSLHYTNLPNCIAL